MNKAERLFKDFDKLLDVLSVPNEIPKGSFYDLSRDQDPAGDVDQDKKRKRGGQPGNQNARKHGFYSRHFTPEQMKQLEEVSCQKDLDPEIALLRVKLDALLDGLEVSTELLIRAINSPPRLIAIQRRYIYG